MNTCIKYKFNIIYSNSFHSIFSNILIVFIVANLRWCHFSLIPSFLLLFFLNCAANFQEHFVEISYVLSIMLYSRLRNMSTWTTWRPIYSTLFIASFLLLAHFLTHHLHYLRSVIILSLLIIALMTTFIFHLLLPYLTLDELHVLFLVTTMTA